MIAVSVGWLYIYYITSVHGHVRPKSRVYVTDMIRYIYDICIVAISNITFGNFNRRAIETLICIVTLVVSYVNKRWTENISQTGNHIARLAGKPLPARIRHNGTRKCSYFFGSDRVCATCDMSAIWNAIACGTAVLGRKWSAGQPRLLSYSLYIDIQYICVYIISDTYIYI